MSQLPARDGLNWLKQGFGLFRRQPGAMFTLLLGYMLVMLTISIVPVAGQILPVVLLPLFSMTFLQACADIDHGQRLHPRLLLVGFRKPTVVTMLQLGLLYLLVAALAVGATWLVDDGAFWHLVTGELDPKSAIAQQAPLGAALLLAMFVYIPAGMAFCFGAPLICWQHMSLGKALFYSFFAVLRSVKAFLMFILSWFLASMLLNQLVLLIFGREEAAVILMVSVSLLLTLILHCAFYASYRQIFGTPPASEAPPAADAVL